MTPQQLQALQSLRGVPGMDDEQDPQGLDPRIAQLISMRQQTLDTPQFVEAYQNITGPRGAVAPPRPTYQPDPRIQSEMAGLDQRIAQGMAPRPQAGPWATIGRGVAEGLAFGANAPQMAAQREQARRQALLDLQARRQALGQEVRQGAQDFRQEEDAAANERYRNEMLAETRRARTTTEDRESRLEAQNLRGEREVVGDDGNVYIEYFDKANPAQVTARVKKGSAAKPDTTLTPFEAWRKENPTAPLKTWFDLSQKDTNLPARQIIQGTDPVSGEPGYYEVPRGGGAPVKLQGVGGTKQTHTSTNAENRALNFYMQAKDANDVADGMEDMVSKMGLGGQVRLNAAPNILQSSDQQVFNQAARQFTEARLRKVSGAVVRQDEYDNDRKMYFPMPGDGPDVLARKKAARQNVLAGISKEAGNAYREMYPNETGKPNAGAAASSGGASTFSDGGKTFKIPAGQESAFLKDHPNAKKVGP
jgi:hypothetical protein